MRRVTHALKRLIRNATSSPRRALPPAALAKLVREVERTQDVEYSCDDVHRLLDQFAEAVLRGKDAARLMPLVQQHIDLCPDCREEFEALMRILRASPA
jgi:hypothetical protein